MGEFLDILESALKSGKTPLGSIILPLIFLGYPTPELKSIFVWYGWFTPGGALLAVGERDQNGTPPLFESVMESIASSYPSIHHWRANLSPGRLEATIEAMLDYRAPLPTKTVKPNAILCQLCKNLEPSGPLLNALVWLLPKAGFSKKILTFSKRKDPDLCIKGPCRELQKCLDEYNVRVRNKGLNLGKERSSVVAVSEPSGYLAHEGECEREAIRVMRENHATEISALLSALTDSHRTVNNLREENGLLREENGQLRNGLDRFIDVVRASESLREACTKLEMERSHIPNANTRD